MLRTFLRSKIHRATVTEADPDYVGSISIDEDLMDLAEMQEYEAVDVADIDNGERLTTYVLKAPRGSGVIGINGAAARKISVGHKVIIFAYCQLHSEEIEGFVPNLVFVNHLNQPVAGPLAEVHGQTF